MSDLPEIELGKLLRAQGLRLASAESCTGGLIASRITDVPGSSFYFLGGIVAYANEIKVSILGVTWKTLQQHGAVSRETVIEMACGARKNLGADLAVSVSGIAGPDGGSPDKPVGTTWIGLSAAEGEWTRKFIFSGNRTQNKTSAATEALQFVLDYLGGVE